MGDRIAVMRKGLLQQIGTPQELYTSPANTFVASFIGSPAMNLVPAATIGIDRDWTARRLPARARPPRLGHGRRLWL